MKNTIKNLYNIDAISFIKYSDKVYKINSEDCDYCLKYVDNQCNNNIYERLNNLNLTDSFILPMKTCIRSLQGQKDNKMFYVSKWIDNDYVESKDLKLKYYLRQIGLMHNKSSFTNNVSISYFKEITMQLEEMIEECYQKYEKIMYVVEKKEYKSPFEWYFVEHFKDVILSLDKARENLNMFKELVKDKSTIRQTIIHQNFSYDHVFITKNKIIANDKMKVSTPVYDIYSLFLSVEFGSIDISGLIDEYFKENELLDYEIKWLLTLLFIVNDMKLSSQEYDNLNQFMNNMFRFKSVLELENRLKK